MGKCGRLDALDAPPTTKTASHGRTMKSLERGCMFFFFQFERNNDLGTYVEFLRLVKVL